MKTALRKMSNWGNFLKRLQHIYPVDETDLSVCTEIKELPLPPEFPTAVRISDLVAQLEELMGRMNPTSYGPTELHLWLVGMIAPRTGENCMETSERKARGHSYDDLVDLFSDLAMERENDSHMDQYLRKHLQRETHGEKSPGGRSPQPHSNPAKGRDGQLKHIKDTPSCKGKGAPNLFYSCPTDGEGGPCHVPHCDEWSVCMLQPQCKQKYNDGQEVKHQDHFRCTIMCAYCGGRRHYEDECHMKLGKSEKLKKAEEERLKTPVRVNARGEATILGHPPVSVTLVEDEGAQPPPLVEEEHPTKRPRVRCRMTSGMPPPPLALAAQQSARTPRSARLTSTLSACRLLEWT